MDFTFEKKWLDLLDDISANHGERLDLQSILFLVGIQELNKGYIKLSKDQKLEVMHIAVCTLLEPYGYYEYSGHDDDGWPHFEAKKNLPSLNPEDQEKFMKQALMDYFKKN